MPVRNRNGKLEWRFKVNGHEYSHITDLEDTARNVIRVQRMEAEARRLVLEGRATELKLQIQPFNSAAEAFIEWAKGEYKAHPNTWKRLRGSMTSLTEMFGRRPVSSITRGDLEDYKSWRRRTHEVEEVTIRHDLHALSLLFQYGQKHNWCKTNPVREVEIPSDSDATRINPLSREQEGQYFAACAELEARAVAKKQARKARGYQDLADLHRLMLLQGCRPEELRELEQRSVDLEHGRFTVQFGKSNAAKRTLRMRAEARDIFVRRLQAEGRWVFPSQKNPGRHIGQHQRLQESIVRQSGVLCVPYDFRHRADSPVMPTSRTAPLSEVPAASYDSA